MKPLYNYLRESLKKPIKFSLEDMIETGVWIPNDDITPQEHTLIVSKFDDTFELSYKGVREVAGELVLCRYSRPSCEVEFEIKSTPLNDKELYNVIETIANFLTNVIYSVCGGAAEIKNLIKKIK